MLRAHFLAFFFFMSSQALAVEITCEDLLGTESATLVNGDFSIKKTIGRPLLTFCRNLRAFSLACFTIVHGRFRCNI